MSLREKRENIILFFLNGNYILVQAYALTWTVGEAHVVKKNII